jgi:hypothetical protein
MPKKRTIFYRFQIIDDILSSVVDANATCTIVDYNYYGLCQSNVS